MQLTRIIEREWQDLKSSLSPYISELGTVAFLAAGVFAVVMAVVEFLQPGFAANFVSPRSVLAAVVLSGGLALVGPHQKSRSRRQKLMYAMLGILAAVLSFWAAWYYFQSVPEIQAKLSWAAALIVGFLFWTAARRTEDQHL